MYNQYRLTDKVAGWNGRMCGIDGIKKVLRPWNWKYVESLNKNRYFTLYRL